MAYQRLPVAVVAIMFGLCTSSQPRLSIGCSKRSSHEPQKGSSKFGDLVEKVVSVPDFETIERTYWVAEAPKPGQPAPVLIAIHGQTDVAKNMASYHNFSGLAYESNLMVAYPQGMNDSYPGEEQGTGWNVGSAGDNATCVPQGVGDSYGCYKSCRKLQKCGRCNWSTCYNDVLFIKVMLNALAEEFCIDLDRVYVQGESNGAMMVQHLLREMPHEFAGAASWFGTPLLGYILGSSLQLVDSQPLFSRTAILALHGRNDTTIPPEGGVDDGGWLYEPLEQATGVWAALHRCKRPATSVSTRWDGGPLNFRCKEYSPCLTGRRVMQCMYDGQHGDYPSGHDGDQITLWFLLQFSRGSPATEIENDGTVAFVL